ATTACPSRAREPAAAEAPVKRPVREIPATAAALPTTCAVEVGLRVLPLPRTARLFGAPLRQGPAPPAAEPRPARLGVRGRRRARAVQRVMRHWPFGDTCLRHALVAGQRLRRSSPELVVGVARPGAGGGGGQGRGTGQGARVAGVRHRHLRPPPRRAGLPPARLDRSGGAMSRTRLYGLVVDSDVELHQLRPTSAAPDVTIRTGAQSAVTQQVPEGQRLLHLEHSGRAYFTGARQEDRYLLRFYGTCDFVIAEDLSRIDLHAVEGTDPDTIG